MDALPVRYSVATLILMGVLTACDGEQATEESAIEPSPRVVRSMSFVAQLGLLPMPPSDAIRYVSIVDMRALSAANGVDIPDRSDEAAVLEWTRVLAGNGSSPSVAGAALPWVIRGEPAAFTAETGLSAADFRTVASMITTPEEFTVVRGRWAAVVPPRTLVRVDEGIVSVGRGDDYASDAGGSPRGTDFYGRPVRLARDRDRIALSLSTPMTRRWRDHRGPDLADDPSLLAIGQRLDKTKAVSAYLVAPAPGGVAGAFGIAWAVDRDGPQILAVYDAGCAYAANRLSRSLENAFGNDLRLTSSAVDGRTVLATLTLGVTASVLTPLEALENGSWPQPELAPC